MSDRRICSGALGAPAAASRRGGARAAGAEPITEAIPTALYQQPAARHNLVRVTVTGLAAPAARARVTDRRGTLIGTAGVLPSAGEAGVAREGWGPPAGGGGFPIGGGGGKQRGAPRPAPAPARRPRAPCLLPPR